MLLTFSSEAAFQNPQGGNTHYFQSTMQANNAMIIIFIFHFGLQLFFFFFDDTVGKACPEI